jgi:FkbM family methyltransferase
MNGLEFKKMLGNIDKWVSNDGDNSHRLNYELNDNSIVFDLGGYEGWFTNEINKRYKSKIYCFEPVLSYFNDIKYRFKKNENIQVFQLAISNINGKKILYNNNNESSLNVITNSFVEIDCIRLDTIMFNHQISYIDLIKINIEGEEYSLLESMIDSNILKKCGNIQIQFHTFIDDYETKYLNIKCLNSQNLIRFLNEFGFINS